MLPFYIVVLSSYSVSDCDQFGMYALLPFWIFVCSPCTNLVHTDHITIIAEFATNAKKAPNATFIDVDNSDLCYVNIRVHSHHGVVAKVFVSSKPRYCLLGNTLTHLHWYVMTGNPYLCHGLLRQYPLWIATEYLWRN